VRRNAAVFQLVTGRLFEDEAHFQAEVIKAAKRMGWGPIYHTHDSRRSEEGFLDLVMCHQHQRRVIFAELKNNERAFTPEQLHWYGVLIVCGQEAYLWRFKDWDAALAILLRRPGGAT
jgi:hypothetical protein